MHEMQRAQRFVRWMAYFWNTVTYLMLLLLSVVAFSNHPDLRHSWRGLALVGAILLYGGWYGAGFLLVIGRDRAWQPEFIWRRALYWVVQIACGFLLMSFDGNYSNLMWVSLGTALSFVAMPWSAFLAALPALVIIHYWGIWPDGSLKSWLIFGGISFTFIIYCAMIYMPMLLIKHRFTQAQLYRDLETAHEELAAAHAQLAASAEQERELAVLRERERLARDLHDTLGHALVLATVKLEAIRRLARQDPERVERESVATQGIVRDAMTDLRATLVALHSPDLAGEPMAVTLARRVREAAQRAGFEVEVRLCSTSAEWPRSVQSALLHIGVEAVANVERHAQARHVHLTIISEDGYACLAVADDGVGLPDLPPATDGGATSPSGHYGLAGMRERVAELGGTLAIISAPGRGTEISARVPLASGEAAVPAIEEPVYA
jgi:signal transduction histidine kinase